MTFQNVVDFLQANNIDIFENCTTPDPINIDTVKSYIMLRCGLLTPVYAEPELMKQQIKMWFDKEQWEFDHLVKILLADYDIIDNVDEYKEWHEKHSGTDGRVLGGSDTLTHGETHTLSGSDTFTHGETHTLGGVDTFTHGETHTLSGTDTNNDTTSTEHSVSAYNSGGYQADSKDQNGGYTNTQYGKVDTASGDDTTEYGKTDTASGQDITGYGKKDTISGDDTTKYGKTDDFTHGENIDYFEHRHGNIGLETPQDIIQKELDMLERFNVYDWIARKFERDNMIVVY